MSNLTKIPKPTNPVWTQEPEQDSRGYFVFTTEASTLLGGGFVIRGVGKDPWGRLITAQPKPFGPMDDTQGWEIETEIEGHPVKLIIFND